jgi:hypothetical protein
VSSRQCTLFSVVVVVSLLTGCGASKIIDASSLEYVSISDVLGTSSKPTGNVRGTAIVDASALRELDLEEDPIRRLGKKGFGLGRMVSPSGTFDTSISNDELFALPSMTPVRRVLDEEFARYSPQDDADLSKSTARSTEFQFFDRSLLYSKRSHFVLAGIVNRMDRAYLSPNNCGEIRLIYRLNYRSTTEDKAVSQPMTLNVVLKAKDERPTARRIALTTCSGIARRWLATAGSPLAGPELVNRLLAAGGPLELVKAANIDRIETNIQIRRVPSLLPGNAQADYLLNVFHYDKKSKKFEQAPLENQIDRDGLLANNDLRSDFSRWLLDADRIRALDAGTILIPDKFLSNSGIATTRSNLAQLERDPVIALVQPDDSLDAVLKESDVVGALKKAADKGVVLQNINSVASFNRRLHDVTCTGCHETRSIGGFHLPGAEPILADASSTTAASAHFFGDQDRRRDILGAFGNGIVPDFSRGFADQPQRRGSADAGTR